MFKFKELRVLSILAIIFAVVVIKLAIAIGMHDQNTIIFALLILFSVLWIGLGRFTMKIGEDYILVYEYKIIGILPSMIEFKDIQDVEVEKYRVRITHHKGKVTKCYMIGANEFAVKLNEKRGSIQ